MSSTTYAMNTSTAPNVVCGEHENLAGQNIFFAVFLTGIFVAAIIGNLLAVMVIIYSRHLRSQPAYFFVASLAVADICVVLFTIPIRIDTYLHNQNFCFNLTACRLYVFTDLIFHVSSVTHLFAIAVDRCIAINMPFSYRSFMTKAVTMASLLCIWVYSTIWGSVGMFRWENPSDPSVFILEIYPRRICMNDSKIYFTVVYVITYLVPLALMALLYASILRVAVRQARAIAALDTQAIQRKKHNARQKKREMRATKTLSIVYGAFVVCWLPVCIITIASSWCPQCFLKFRQVNELAFSIVYALFVEVLPPFNSCINPFIYIIFGVQFRVALKDMTYKFLKKSRDGIFYPDDSTHGDECNTSAAMSRRRSARISQFSTRASRPSAASNEIFYATDSTRALDPSPFKEVRTSSNDKTDSFFACNNNGYLALKEHNNYTAILATKKTSVTFNQSVV